MHSKYNILLLAAGRGTRLKPFTDSWPKCLMPVHGVPLLSYWLYKCRKINNASIFINMHHLAVIVDEFLEDNFCSKNLNKLFESELLGTGGTIVRAYQALKDRPTLVIHADNYSSIDLKDFIVEHEKLCLEQGIKISMSVFECEDPKQFGICITDERNIVTEFYEKQEDAPGKIANAAVYIFEPTVIDFIKEHSCKDLSIDVIPKYLNKIATYPINGIHRDIGSEEQLKKAQNDCKISHSKFFMSEKNLKIFHEIIEKTSSKT